MTSGESCCACAAVAVGQVVAGRSILTRPTDALVDICIHIMMIEFELNQPLENEITWSEKLRVQIGMLN